MSAKNKGFGKEKLLLQMQKEIRTLEFEIKHPNLAKISIIRNLKISARVLQRFAPYVLTAGIAIGSVKYFNNIPFNRDNTLIEFDNNGNLRKEKQYSDFQDADGNSLDNSDSMLYYYSQWQKDENGLYSRHVKTYSIIAKTYEDIINLFDQESLKIEDILGNPISDIKEEKNNLTEEELEEELLFNAVIYNKESIEEDFSFSVFYLLLFLALELGILYYRDKVSNFNFTYSIYEIKEKYHPANAEDMIKKLELKKENYDRLAR